ncbi:MAG: hypothetical protein JXA20_20025 [Spirochaetes bacterium]|nr:hypothetical protein [Spirochaetota bacterium]
MIQKLGNSISRVFRNVISPAVSMEYTLLMFATAVFHSLYFGRPHPITSLLAMNRRLPMVLYLYGTVVLVVSCVKPPEEWRPLASMLVLLGSTMISVMLQSLVYMRPFTPSPVEVLAQLIYTLQALVSLVLLLLVFVERHGGGYMVEPRLKALPTPLRAAMILCYVILATLLLHRVFSVDPGDATDYVTVSGFLILEGERSYRRLRRRSHRED